MGLRKRSNVRARLTNHGRDRSAIRWALIAWDCRRCGVELINFTIPGNLLVAAGRLTAVLDWGGLGAGDPAQDLDPAWSVLDTAGAAAFRQDLDVDEASWLRACGFALEQAIGGVIYYTPRRHSLGEVMQRTLQRLLSRR